MLKVLRDLLRHNREFAIGVTLLAIVIAVAATSLFSPYPPEDSYVVPPDVPPPDVVPPVEPPMPSVGGGGAGGVGGGAGGVGGAGGGSTTLIVYRPTSVQTL